MRITFRLRSMTVFIVLVMTLMSCKESHDIKTVEGCEYIDFYGDSGGYTHKGNCKNHKNK